MGILQSVMAVPTNRDAFARQFDAVPTNLRRTSPFCRQLVDSMFGDPMPPGTKGLDRMTFMLGQWEKYGPQRATQLRWRESRKEATRPPRDVRIAQAEKRRISQLSSAASSDASHSEETNDDDEDDPCSNDADGSESESDSVVSLDNEHSADSGVDSDGCSDDASDSLQAFVVHNA